METCENTLVIEAHTPEGRRQLKDLIDKCRNAQKVFTIETLYPLPDEAVADEYTWKLQNWGTRYSMNPIIIQNRENVFVAYFESKNSPPDKWLEKVSSDYPELDFDLEYVIFGIGGEIIKASKGTLCYKKSIQEEL